jgi:hypothetical protein
MISLSSEERSRDIVNYPAKIFDYQGARVKNSALTGRQSRPLAEIEKKPLDTLSRPLLHTRPDVIAPAT